MSSGEAAQERLFNPPAKQRGRPAGSQGKKPKASLRRVLRAQDLINEGRAPVNVMLRNMWWWDETANNLGAQLLQHSEALKFAQNDEAKFDALRNFNELLEKFFHARDKAQDCAVDAAPYFHARLQNIKVDASITNVTPQKLAKDAPEEKFIEGYSSLVSESYKADGVDAGIAPEFATTEDIDHDTP